MYVAPHLRRHAGAASDAVTPAAKEASTASREQRAGSRRPLEDDDTSRPDCICLRRSGRCTCPADSTWLQRKRRCVVPYVPPHVKTRQAELDRMRAKLAAEDAAAVESEGHPRGCDRSEKGSVASGGSINVRTLARQWGTRLENKGECRFNPLQMDGQIILEDIEGLVAECVEHPLSTKGVKALPAVREGRYQYEVELLRDCALMVGWSGGMTLPGLLDFQGYGYASDGEKWHGQEEICQYGKPFGRKGDIVGALLAWRLPERGGNREGHASLEISFCLNGQALGTAFEVMADSADMWKEAPVPLQPHICQLPNGPMMRARLRGSASGMPLAHPVEGYQPLSAISDGDFCPFSAAVASAAAERVVAAVTPEQLRSFWIPDGHIAEIYDIPSDADISSLSVSITRSLGLADAAASTILHARLTEPGAATALLACRRPGHVQRLVAQQEDGASQLQFAVRPLRHATASSKERLREWRGEEFRPHADCSAARRMIHGCLQAPMPLSHLVEEKNRRPNAVARHAEEDIAVVEILE